MLAFQNAAIAVALCGCLVSQEQLLEPAHPLVVGFPAGTYQLKTRTDEDTDGDPKESGEATDLVVISIAQDGSPLMTFSAEDTEYLMAIEPISSSLEGLRIFLLGVQIDYSNVLGEDFVVSGITWIDYSLAVLPDASPTWALISIDSNEETCAGLYNGDYCEIESRRQLFDSVQHVIDRVERMGWPADPFSLAEGVVLYTRQE